MYQPGSIATGGGNEIVRAGYLTKSPPEDAPSISQWRRRWFVLRDSLRSYPLAERYVRLEYYQNEGEARKLADPKGIINLTECYRVSGCAPVKGHKFVFDVCTKERKYHLAAETPSEKHEWIQILNEVLFSTTVAPPQVKTQDLEDAEFQIQRRKSQSRAVLNQVSLQADVQTPRALSFYEAPVETRKKRPLPPTPDDKVPSLGSVSPSLPVRNSPVPPIPKPRNKPLEVQKSLPVGTGYYGGSNGSLNNIETSGPSIMSRGGPSPSFQATISQPTASDYEVPIQTLNKQPITHGRNSISAPALQHDYDEALPPLPPPRRTGQQQQQAVPSSDNTDRFGSLPDINTDYDIVTLPEGEQQDEEEEAYGHLIRIPTYEPRMRHSDPAVIPLYSPSSSTTTQSHGSPMTEGKRYYENTGFTPIKEETYTKLSHYH